MPDGKFKLKVGINLNDSELKNQLKTLSDNEYKVKIKLDTQSVQKQINNIRKQIEALGKITINLNGSSNNKGGSGGSNTSSNLKEVNNAYKEMINLIKKINSTKVKLAGLDSSKNPSQIAELESQLKTLESTYTRIRSRFKDKLTTGQREGLASEFKKGSNELAIMDAKMKDTSAINARAKAYKELDKIEKEIGNTELKIASLKSSTGNNSQIKELESQLKALEKTYKSIIVSMEHPLSSEQWTSLNEQIQQTDNKLAELNAKILDTKTKLADTIASSSSMSKAETQMSKASSAMNKLDSASSELQASFNKLESEYNELVSAQENYNSVMRNANATDAEKLASAERLILANTNYQNSLKTTNNYLKEETRLQKENTDAMNLASKKNAFSSEIDAWMTKNSAATKKFGVELQKIKAQISGVDASGLQNLKNQFTEIKNKAVVAGVATQTFGDKFRGAFKDIASLMTPMMLLMKATEYLKEMATNVKDVDSAMTELKKVTNETAETYDRFVKESANSAKEIGSTMTEYINSTADFARLGYSMNDSKELAKVANIYSVVGDEVEGIDEATKSVISTMTAFKDEATNAGISTSDFAMSIIDKYNEVGNNFAISSGGIGNALERSASSLAAANNTLDESIGLITAANTVVQDADVVGTAFKTKFFRDCLYVQKCA